MTKTQKKSSVVVTYRVFVTKRPVAGRATYRKGKLVFIVSGCRIVEGHVSNFFNWRQINTDGSFGRWGCGYWDDDWSQDV
jgi:hypothetical protein